jgi:hypothetical protein
MHASDLLHNNNNNNNNNNHHNFLNRFLDRQKNNNNKNKTRFLLHGCYSVVYLLTTNTSFSSDPDQRGCLQKDGEQ